MAKFEVLNALGPDWPALSRNARARLLEELQKPDWLRGPQDRRFGFREVGEYVPGTFSGYFAVESRLRYIVYDDKGSPPERDEVEEYERVLFLLIVSEGRVVVHDRRFFRTDLGKALVRDMLVDALRRLTFSAAIGNVATLQPFEQALTDEQMLERFFSEPDRVLRIAVRELHGKHVPREFRFFNPRFELDEEVHDFLDDQFTVIDEVALESEGSVDLRASKLAQGVARTGAVQEFQRQDPVGRRNVVRRRIPPSFDQEIDLDDPSIGLAALTRAVLDRYERLYPHRYDRGDEYAGGLFEGQRHDEPEE